MNLPVKIVSSNGQVQATEVPTLDYVPAAPSNARRGIWGLTDQGVVSFGNFATNILLARYLSLHDFGCFAILFDVMLLLNSLTGAAVCYPLSIRGAAGGTKRLREYTTASIALTGLWLLPLGMALALTAALMTHNIAVAGCAVFGLIGWQLQETTRRGLMAQSRFADAIWGDAIGYPLQAVLLIVLGATQRLTLESAFITIGVTSLGAFILQWIQIGIATVHRSAIAQIGLSFWQSGRWMLLTNIASIPTVQAITWVLGSFAGLAVVGQYGAIVALLRIINPVISGISGVIIPGAAQARSEGGMRAAWRSTMHHALQGGALLLPCFLILLAIPHHVLSLVYGAHSPYVGIGNALRIYAAAGAVYFVAQILLTFLAAVERTREVFAAQCCTTIATLLISLPLTARYGLYGVVIGVAVSSSARIIAALFAFRYVNWSECAGDPPIQSHSPPVRLPSAA